MTSILFPPAFFRNYIALRSVSELSWAFTVIGSAKHRFWVLLNRSSFSFATLIDLNIHKTMIKFKYCALNYEYQCGYRAYSIDQLHCVVLGVQWRLSFTITVGLLSFAYYNSKFCCCWSPPPRMMFMMRILHYLPTSVNK